jgi:hypothetical protein
MTIKQLSVFLENKSGRLTEVLGALGKHNITIKALTVADTSEYGILRLVVTHPDEAFKLLKEREFSVSLTDVISVATTSEAGSFSKVLSVLSEASISIEYVYAFSIGNKAALIIRTDDIPATIDTLQKHSIKLLKSTELEKF